MRHAPFLDRLTRILIDPNLTMSLTRLAAVVCLASAGSLSGTGCGLAGSDTAGGWTGTIDTLSSGEIIARNPDEPIWTPDEGWQIVEEMRYGSDTGEDAILLGTIRSFDVDAEGRVYALDRQSQEIYVFAPDGALVRTIGREGAGPGEYENAAAVDISQTGEIWVMEMQKGQLTILNPDGEYLRTEQVNSSGWDYSSYPGGFDRIGRYNAFIYSFDEETTTEHLARFDQTLAPLDTIALPESPVEIELFEFEDDGATMSVSIPFQGSFDWQFSPSGNFWTLLTRPYELAEVTAEGKVLRRVTKEYQAPRVTGAEIDEAREQYTWFTDQGGKFDESKIPDTKPVVSTFFCDDEGNLWVRRIETSPEAEARLFDLFNAEGRFLGEVRFPFPLQSNPEPIVRDGMLYGITTDDLGAELIVRARIEKS